MENGKLKMRTWLWVKSPRYVLRQTGRIPAMSAWLSRINAIFMLIQSIGLIESNVLTTQRPQMERFGACPRFSLLSSVPTNKLSGAQQQQVRNMHKTLYGI